MMKAEHFETTFPTCLLEPSTSQFRYAKYTSMIIYANIVNMICMYINDYKRKQVILQLQSIAYRDMVYVWLIFEECFCFTCDFFHLSRVTSVINIFNITCVAQEPGDVPNHSPSSSFSSSLNSTFVYALAGWYVTLKIDCLIPWLIDWLIDDDDDDDDDDDHDDDHDHDHDSEKEFDKFNKTVQRCNVNFMRSTICVLAWKTLVVRIPHLHHHPIFLYIIYIQHNKLPSKQANGDGSQVSKQPASTSFRWQPGWCPLFTAGIVSSAIRDPDAWKTGVENTTEYHYIKTWWIFFGGVGWRGGNMKLGSCPCQPSRCLSCVSLVLSIYTMYFRDTGACLTFVSCWIRSPTDSDRFW